MKTLLTRRAHRLGLLPAAASAQEHKTYRCKVADVVSLAEDGRLRTTITRGP